MQQQQLAIIKDRGDAYTALANQYYNFDELLDKIAQATPEKLTITSLSLESGKPTSIVGVAADRSDISTLTENIRKISEITDISLSQTTAQEDGVHFTIGISLVTKVKPSPSPKSSASATDKQP